MGSEEINSSTHSPLNYRPPSGRNRWIIRIGGWGIVIAAAIMGYKWLPACYRTILLLHHQRACLTYNAPPDQVVFDNHPQRVAILAKDPNYTIFDGCAYRNPPKEWESLNKDWPSLSPNAAPQGGVAIFGPVSGDSNASYLPPAAAFAHQKSWAAPSGVLFLHEMSKNGVRKLVVVQRIAATNGSTDFSNGNDIDVTVLGIATFEQPRNELYVPDFLSVVDGAFGTAANKPQISDTRIYAGQIDPTDAAHFTIRCEQNGKSILVDGWFDGISSVKFEKRNVH